MLSSNNAVHLADPPGGVELDAAHSMRRWTPRADSGVPTAVAVFVFDDVKCPMSGSAASKGFSRHSKRICTRNRGRGASLSPAP
jgi:hypothetical protein